MMAALFIASVRLTSYELYSLAILQMISHVIFR